VFTSSQERAAIDELGRLARRTRDASQAKAKLTERELEILELLARGHANPAIARQLFLSPKTVEYHLGKAFLTLGVTSRAELSRAFARD
jgi:DNA-binding NarL/FixJ family response regulator